MPRVSKAKQVKTKRKPGKKRSSPRKKRITVEVPVAQTNVEVIKRIF